MRFTTVMLSCFASQMAVQATSFVTIVKTVLEDTAVSSVDFSTPALDHTSYSELPKISRRGEDNLIENTSMTRIHLTSPYTTDVDIPLTLLPSGYVEPTNSTRSTRPAKTPSMTRVHFTSPYTTDVDIPLTLLPTGKSIKPVGFTTSTTSTRSITYTTFSTWKPPTTSTTSTKTPANACDIYPYPDGYCNASGTLAP